MAVSGKHHAPASLTTDNVPLDRTMGRL